MKKLLAMILVCAMLLCACGQKSDSDEIREINYDRNFCNDGALILEQISGVGSALKFIDFKTMQSAFICPRPNCKHDDPDTCSAFGMDNGPTLYKDHIWFFNSDAKMKDGKPQWVLEIIRANTDGTGRITVKTIENRNSMHYDFRYLIGSTLYFTTVENWVGENGGTNSDGAYYLCSFDLDTNEYREIGKLVEGYGAGTRIMGVYNGGLYIDASRRTVQEPIPWQNFMDIDFVASIEYDNFNTRYDLESGEFTDLEDMFPVYANGKYLVTESHDDDRTVTVHLENGDTLDITGILWNDIVNDRIFSPYSGVVIDLKTGKRYEMLTDKSVIYYIDGEYVLKHDLLDEDRFIVGTEYTKAAEDEIIGGEIKE